MPRPHLLLEHRGYVFPHEKLDPRYHPLGQPGPRRFYGKFIAAIPYGLRVPTMVMAYCFVCWHVRHWLYPYGPRTTANVRIPIHDDDVLEAEWEMRFRKQEDIFRWGHIYYAMQERRLAEARKEGLIE